MAITLTFNQLEGTIPSSFKELQYITKISFSFNNLWGNLFDWLTPYQLSNITELILTANLF